MLMRALRDMNAPKFVFDDAPPRARRCTPAHEPQDNE